MAEKEFYTKYIAPFYIDLMNLNFVEKSEDQVICMFGQLKELSKELEEQVLIGLLNEAWRPSKVAAWMIGLSKRSELISQLINYLSKESVHYSEHVLINLMILEKQYAGKEIVKFIKQQVKYYLKTEDIINLERLSIDWGISILKHLDESYNSTYVEEVKNSSWWLEFDNNFQKNSFYSRIREKLELNHQVEAINVLMERMKKYDSLKR